MTIIDYDDEEDYDAQLDDAYTTYYLNYEENLPHPPEEIILKSFGLFQRIDQLIRDQEFTKYMDMTEREKESELSHIQDQLVKLRRELIAENKRQKKLV